MHHSEYSLNFTAAIPGDCMFDILFSDMCWKILRPW